MKTRNQELLEALTVLFHPFVLAALEPKIRTDMATYVPQPVDMTPEELAQLSDFLRAAAKETLIPEEEAEALIEGAAEELRNPKPFTPEEIDQAVRDESQLACDLLVRLWINTILFIALDGAQFTAASIDDAMLPPLAGVEAEEFGRACDQTHLGRAGVRNVLRQVKATLSPGRPMPAEAIEFLELEGVTLT